MKNLAALLCALLALSRAEDVRIDLWIMSQCPFGARAVERLFSMKNLFPETQKTEITVHYVLDYDASSGQFHSLHGNDEVEEDIRQLVIQKHFPGRFWCYVVSRASHFQDTIWAPDAAICGIDTAKVREYMRLEGEELGRREAALCESLAVTASPTLFFNGKRLRDWRGDITTLYMVLRGEMKAGGNLPRCFDDNDCLPPDPKYIPRCVENACLFELAPAVELIVVAPDTTLGDPAQNMIQILRSFFRNLKVRYVLHGTDEAERLERKLKLEALPAYIFDEALQKTEAFGRVEEKLIPVELDGKRYFLVKPTSVELTFFPHRERRKGELVAFVMSGCPFSKALEESLYATGRTGNVTLRYLVWRDESGALHSAHGPAELEENKRQATIQKFFPESFWDYLACYNASGEAEGCCKAAGIDPDSLNALVSLYGDSLLALDAALCDSLNIRKTPTLLWENQTIVTDRTTLTKLLGFSLEEGHCSY